MTDVLWESGPLGKLHVRFGKGSRRRGPKQRITPLINGSRPLLEWFVADVRGQFDYRWMSRLSLLRSERKTSDGDACRVSAETLRAGLPGRSPGTCLPGGAGSARTCCGTPSRPRSYRDGVDIAAIQELLGHEWITTMGIRQNYQRHSYRRLPAAGCRALGSAADGFGKHMKWTCAWLRRGATSGTRPATCAAFSLSTDGDQRGQDVRPVVRAAGLLQPR